MRKRLLKISMLALATAGAAAPPVEAMRPKADAVVANQLQPERASAAVVIPTSAIGTSKPQPTAQPETAKTAGNGIWAKPGIRPIETPEPTQPLAVRDPLDVAVDEAIGITARRVLSVETHTPWQIGHGMLAYRRDYVVKKDGVKINAFEWVQTNPSFNGRNWFHLTSYGAGPQKFTQPYEFEGHPNQFLAFFAMSRLPKDYPFQIEGRQVDFNDFLNNAKMTVTDREEITWTLWLFSYYLEPSARWYAADGQPWSMERLMSTQLRQPVTKAPCGGCHGLFALASARNAYLQAGNRLNGVWLESHMYLQRYIEEARAAQNNDGSFSSNYFKGPGYADDFSKRISTTGHTLEFLMMALPQDRLKEPWVRKAVAAVARDLVTYRAEPVEVGGMYHAAHSLVLYRERTRPQFVAEAAKIRPVSGEKLEEVSQQIIPAN